MENEVTIRRFSPTTDVSDVAAVCAAVGWGSYADTDIARRGCDAPGVVTTVAVAESRVVGFAQVLSDGVVTGYLSQVVVLEDFRRQGIARRLINAAFDASGAQRLDLVTDDAHDFYRSFAHREKAGFRIYPQK